MRILIIFLLVSCAKVSYIAEQGIGQVALEYNDIDNEDFLKDPKQKQKYKDKVKLIEKAKSYFFDYYGLKQNAIYDEVKILDQEAVTYLVIHSPVDKIKAIETSFPIVGSFPYLGFFSKESALSFKDEKEKEGFHTYMRPVYAYSTLNHKLWPFYDNILSSFFYYSDKALVELIFHELVHTIIFVGDNVGFNENLAQFISEKMVVEYFKYSKEEQDLIVQKKRRYQKLNQRMVELSKILSKNYEIKKESPVHILREFLNGKFYPEVQAVCSELKMEKCWPLKENWNNARFAALGTYEGKRNDLAQIYIKKNLSLKDFVMFLRDKEKKFDGNTTFLKYLNDDLKKD